MLNSKLVSFLSALGVASLLAASLMITTHVDAGKIYTWKDAAGVVHYSDKPFPQARDTKTLKLETTTALPKAESDELAAPANQPELINANNTKEVDAACRSARNNLVGLLNPKKIIKRENEEGQEVTLTDAEIQAEVQKNQTYLSSYCQRTPVSNVTQDVEQVSPEPVSSGARVPRQDRLLDAPKSNPNEAVAL